MELEARKNTQRGEDRREERQGGKKKKNQGWVLIRRNIWETGFVCFYLERMFKWFSIVKTFQFHIRISRTNFYKLQCASVSVKPAGI